MSEPAWVPLGPGAVLDVGPEVAYQEFTADVPITVTSEATAQTIVTAPAFTADGSSTYLIEFFSSRIFHTAQNVIRFVLYEDGVSIGLIGDWDPPAATFRMPVRLARRRTPAAGSRTYSIRAMTGGGTGTIGAGVGGVGAYVPGFIRITKVPSAVPGPAGLVPPTAIGTSLPASPVDGQEFILTDSLTAPTYSWRLRYVAAKASNRWVYLGGSPIYAEVAAGQVSASTTYVTLAGGPSIAVPVAGDYMLDIGAWMGIDVGGSTQIFMSYDIGATAAVDTDAVVQQIANGGEFASNTRARRKALTAVTLTAKGRVSGGNGNWLNRWMRLTPVAVGG